jgi:hypothetical protein
VYGRRNKTRREMGMFKIGLEIGEDLEGGLFDPPAMVSVTERGRDPWTF